MNPREQLLLLAEPYLSPFLRETLVANRLPVVLNEAAGRMGVDRLTHGLDEMDAVARARSSESLDILTVSENSIEWIDRHLPDHALTSWAHDFKNKARFRALTRSIYPDLFFLEVQAEDLQDLDLSGIPLPFIIKPSVGFFSLGVQRVVDAGQWSDAQEAIRCAIRDSAELFPQEVLGLDSWLIEEWIEGEELAVDAYYDDQGETVVLGIWRHAFASDADTSDRVYSTSREIVESDLLEVQECLDRIGSVTGARSFPLHAELRRTESGFVPIEINALRFGGWCTTADLGARAYGFNPYLAFFRRQAPDWSQILADMDDSLHSIVVLDNSTGLEAREIAAFDYASLVDRFANPLELREVDYTRYPLFGFLFLNTPGHDRSELEWILRSDLREFVTRDS